MFSVEKIKPLLEVKFKNILISFLLIGRYDDQQHHRVRKVKTKTYIKNFKYRITLNSPQIIFNYLKPENFLVSGEN